MIVLCSFLKAKADVMSYWRGSAETSKNPQRHALQLIDQFLFVLMRLKASTEKI